MAPRADDDAASASSAGSGSSAGSAKSARGEQAEQSMKELDQEADNLLNNALGVRKTIFSVLYTIGTEKYDNLLRFAAARLILDYLQLFLVLMRPAHGFVFNSDLWVWHAIKWIEFANPLTSDNYEFYVWWIYVAVIILAVAYGIAAWIAFSFRRNRFTYIWPIMLLRLVANAAVFVFYVSCFTVFLVGFNCNWFTKEGGTQRAVMDATGASIIEVSDIRFRLNRFPDRECLALPHLAHGIVALVACGVFVTTAFFVTLTDYDADPASRRWLASSHSSVEIWALTAKTFMVLAMGIFYNQLYFQSVIFCIATLALAYLYIRWQPHYNQWVNHIRSGLYTSLFWMSVFIAVMKFDDKWDVPGHRKWMTDAMLIGLAPVMVFGFAVSWLRLNLSTRRILKAVVSAHEDCRVKDMYWFSTPEEVEIVSRVGRRWLKEDDEILDPEAVGLAELVIKIGLAHFPNEPKMGIAHANFVFSMQHDPQLGMALLQHVLKLEDTNMADEFIVFAREQDIKAVGKDKAHEGTFDLTAYVEFQRNFRMLARSHRAALIAQRKFWMHLLHQDVAFLKLMELLGEIDATAKKCDKMFQVLLERYPSNERLFRMYSRFLEHVRNDPWTASKYTMLADKLDEADTDAGAGLLVREDVDAITMLEHLNEKVHCIIVINAEGVIQVANKPMQKLAGYKKTELEGKNISMLMPAPFNQRHNGYLRAYQNTGRKKILDSQREVVVLHKNRTVFPVQVAITKVSGVGSDSIFLGVMRTFAMPPGIIRVWCTPAGGVISADERFFDSFGKTYNDVAGRPFSGLTRDQDTIIKLLDRAQAATEDDFKSGKVKQKGVFVLHQYMEPVEVDISVVLGGTDSQRLLAFDIRCIRPQGMIMVTNDKGRLLYMNSDTRKLLGVGAAADVTKLDLAHLMPPPSSLLHSKWIREPSAKVPKQSCRSGATVVMADTKGVAMPVRPTIMTREVSENVQHVIQLEESSWDRGLDERRLVLTLDSCGIVVATNTALPSLFGFKPSQLVGMCVSSIVDVLAVLRDDLQGVLAKMAQKVTAKPGYSWRVGVFPPSKPLSELTEMEKKVQERSTRPALMMLELKEVSEDEMPEIKLHLYKADMLSGIIEMDHSGMITKPSMSQLDPTGLLFGCSERSMVRRPIRHYINLPSKHPETLLQDDKVKGAMKTGTQGRKVGPLKSLTGTHVDGAPLKLKVLAMSTTNRRIVAKCGLETLVTGDVELFKETLTHDAPKGGKKGGSQWAKGDDEDGKSVVAAAAGGRDAGGGKKGVKFAGGGAESSSSGEEEEEEEEEEGGEEGKEEADEAEAQEAFEDEEESEVDEDPEATAAAAAALETDWRRGRRLKKLYQMLNTQHAKAHYTRYVWQSYFILSAVCGVHTVMFVVLLAQMLAFDGNKKVLDANGQVIFDSQAIVIEARKLSNMFNGITHPNIYPDYKDTAELKDVLKTMDKHIKEMEKLHQGVYLGFAQLERIRDEFNLRELWEGDEIKEDLLIDTRMPRTERDSSNIWKMGNQFIASAREVHSNYKKIAAEPGSFVGNRDWRYLIDNGPPFLAGSYVLSLSGLLQSDFKLLQKKVDLLYALMVVDLVVALGAAVWTFYILKNVLNVRHALLSVFLTVPTGFLRALAEKQLAMADEDADGGVDDEDEEEDEAAKAAAAAAAAATAALPVNTTAGKKDDNPRNKPLVIDVDALASGAIADEGASWSERASAAMRKSWTKISNFFKALGGAPIEVGKRKLFRHTRDLFWQVTPYVIWAVIILVVFLTTAQTLITLRRPIQNNYLANRLAGRTSRVTADAHEMCSVDTAAEVIAIRDGGMKTRFSDLVHMYNSLLYGQTTDKRDMPFLTLDGTLFNSLRAQQIFFKSDGKCVVTEEPEKYCFEPGHRFHEVSHNGMDPMMLRFFEEVQLLMNDDPAQIAQEQLGNQRLDYIWNIGWHALVDLQQSTKEFYSSRAQTEFDASLQGQIALFAIMWVLAACYYWFVFKPFKDLTAYEVRQAAELLSQLPAEMGIENVVSQLVVPDDPANAPDAK